MNGDKEVPIWEKRTQELRQRDRIRHDGSGGYRRGADHKAGGPRLLARQRLDPADDKPMSKNRRAPRKRGPRPQYAILEYYQPAFFLIGAELERRAYSVDVPHPLRESFWNLVPEREYDPSEGRGLVSSYLTRIEQELATILSKQSIAYWLHLYRRISPGLLASARMLRQWPSFVRPSRRQSRNTARSIPAIASLSQTRLRPTRS